MQKLPSFPYFPSISKSDFSVGGQNTIRIALWGNGQKRRICKAKFMS